MKIAEAQWEKLKKTKEKVRTRSILFIVVVAVAILNSKVKSFAAAAA